MNIRKWIKRLLIVSVMMLCGQWGGYGYDISHPAAKPTYLERYKKFIARPDATQAFATTEAGQLERLHKQSQAPVTQPRATQPRATQPRATQPVMQPIQPFDFSQYMEQYQPTQWTPPALPAEPQVTQAMILEWQKRARTEAGMQFDPQLLAIQQEVEKMLLGAEQAKGGLEPAYQEVIDYVKKWQEEETGATQRRYYARGLGRGGGLTEREGEISEQALKEVTKAGTEKARQIADIEGQKLLAMEQAGAKKEEVEVQRGRYIAARSADLEESYRQNKTQLEQQRFSNQMNIAQIGMTKEAEEFNRYLATMSLANEVWYKNQTLALQQQSMSLSEKARTEALQWQKEQAGTLSAYQQATFGQQQAQWEAEMAWSREKEGITTPEESSWIDKLNEYIAEQALTDLETKERLKKVRKEGERTSTSPDVDYTHTLGW